MKHTIKFLLISAISMFFGTGLFSQTQVEGSIVETMPVFPSYIAIQSTNDTIVRIKDKVANLPTFIAPTISKQPMMRLVGDPAFNDWVVYMTLKAKLAEDRNDK